MWGPNLGNPLTLWGLALRQTFFEPRNAAFDPYGMGRKEHTAPLAWINLRLRQRPPALALLRLGGRDPRGNHVPRKAWNNKSSHATRVRRGRW